MTEETKIEGKLNEEAVSEESVKETESETLKVVEEVVEPERVIVEEEEEEYTQADLIDKPVENKHVIGEESPERNFVEDMSESMKRTDSTKLWVIFNTFIGVLNLIFLVMIFMTQMVTPV